jgi:hypothetical protein
MVHNIIDVKTPVGGVACHRRGLHSQVVRTRRESAGRGLEDRMIGIENAQSLVGLVAILLVCWAISENRKAFPWKLAIGALLL